MLHEDNINRDIMHHSETVETKEKPLPPYLYYGTGTDFFPPCEGEDIYPECGNVFIHLYDSILPAVCIGATRGEPVIYRVNSGKMAENGFVIRHLEDGVWMAERVPAEYCEKIGR